MNKTFQVFSLIPQKIGFASDYKYLQAGNTAAFISVGIATLRRRSNDLIREGRVTIHKKNQNLR
jgi:hypothetical protein